MKLWILKATKRFTGYSMDQNIIVRATNEKTAREMIFYYNHHKEWFDSDYATCEELLSEGEEGIILVDNNGG